MSQVIIFNNTDGGVSVVHPVASVVAQYGIQAIAKTAVPVGVPYKIVDKADVPSDRTFRDAWEADEAEMTDGTGSVANAISELV